MEVTAGVQVFLREEKAGLDQDERCSGPQRQHSSNCVSLPGWQVELCPLASGPSSLVSSEGSGKQTRTA